MAMKYSVTEAANIIGKSRQYVARLCLQGKITCEKIGNYYMLSDQSIYELKHRTWNNDK